MNEPRIIERKNIIHGSVFARKLAELGLLPPKCRRAVITIDIHDAVLLETGCYGTEDLETGPWEELAAAARASKAEDKLPPQQPDWLR